MRGEGAFHPGGDKPGAVGGEGGVRLAREQLGPAAIGAPDHRLRVRENKAVFTHIHRAAFPRLALGKPAQAQGHGDVGLVHEAVGDAQDVRRRKPHPALPLGRRHRLQPVVEEELLDVGAVVVHRVVGADGRLLRRRQADILDLHPEQFAEDRAVVARVQPETLVRPRRRPHALEEAEAAAAVAEAVVPGELRVHGLVRKVPAEPHQVAGLRGERITGHIHSCPVRRHRGARSRLRALHSSDGTPNIACRSVPSSLIQPSGVC
ncbi:MAG: hypothetical protein BWZ02_01049 [Lentisphaerae bacterium ADurb.BinA184]|nr:MAG: hypothetical protein BWZ02_01049 [Lentisphaerae bacterium ADurb.BinA184]